MADGIRVLYVDDEPSLLEITQMFLEQDGEFSVETATSARRMLDSPSIPSYDVIISDYQMPGMDGIAFLKEVRKRFGDVPFILFTGRGREEVVIDAINNGADFYLQKGGDVEAQFAELAHKIRQAVARKKTECALRESEKRLRLLIQQAPSALAMFDREMCYIVASRRWIADYHLGDQEILGHSHYEIFPEIPEELKVIHRRSLAGEVISADEDKFIRQDGSIQWLSWEVRPWYETGNVIGGIIIFSEDITKRRMAEETMARSKDYLDQIFSSVKAGIVIIDAQTRQIVDINPAGAAMIGLAKEQITGNLCHKFICPAKTGLCPITDLCKTVDNTERILITGDGKKIPIIKYVTRTNLDGRECLLETFIDNSERRLAEDALRKSEEKYRLLTEVTDDVIYMIDLQGTLTHISPQIVRYGYTQDEVIFHDFTEFIAEEDIPDVVADFRNAVSTKTQTVTTIRIRDKAGNLHWMEDNGAPVINDSGSVVAISGILRDITARKRAEDTQKESEEKFRSIFENSPYPIAINSLPDNTFLEVNKAFLDISGYTPAEILGKNPMEMGFLPLTEALRLISHRVLTGKIENVPLAVTAKGGKRVHVLFSTMPVTINNKPAIVTVTAEVTKLKRVEEELLRKNEDLNAACEELTATDEELRQNYDNLSKKEEVLRESEEKFRVLVELSLDGIIIIDFMGKLLFANRAAGLIVDAPDYETLIGKKNVMDFVAPESRAKVIWDFGQVALGIDAYLVNYKLITVTDREVWAECIGKKIPFGNSSAMLVSLRDVTTRKLAEEHVRESENKFSTVFRSSPVSLTLVSATDGKFIDANDAFLKSTGYSRDEVIGKMADDLGIFADKNEYERFSTLLRNHRTVQSMEMKCRIKNGGIRTCRFSSGIILMDDKPHILSTVDDITEQKATMLALNAMVRSMVGTTGLDSLRKITENVSSWLGAECVMVGEIQPDRQTVNVLSMLLDGKEVHDYSYHLKGTPCENVADKGFCLYPDNAIQLFPESKDLIELKIQGYVGTPLRNSTGHVMGILCALSRNPLTSTPTMQEILDIIAVKAAAEIERIQISRALQDSEQLLREVFDNANDAIVLVERARDGYGKYQLVNNTAVQMLGYSKEELLERSPRDNVPEEIAQTIMPEVIEKLTHDGKATFESVNRRKDGSIMPVEVSVRSFRYKGKDVDLAIVRDITERKRAVEALQQANKKLSILSGITRHDIRNQLLTLDGFVALFHKKIPDPLYETYFSRITNASNRITNMIQFTKEYEEIGVHAPVWQDIRYLVDTAVGDVAPDQVRLINDLPAGTEVFADPLIVKVIFNLVDNAVRHGGEITTIRFSLEERDGDRIIVCEDDGGGVPMDEKEIIFDRGFGKNTGFGLAISREILDITGITIKEIGVPGKGARFEITVPKNQFQSAS